MDINVEETTVVTELVSEFERIAESCSLPCELKRELLRIKVESIM
jgi:hypothetical protein